MDIPELFEYLSSLDEVHFVPLDGNFNYESIRNYMLTLLELHGLDQERRSFGNSVDCLGGSDSNTFNIGFASERSANQFRGLFESQESFPYRIVHRPSDISRLKLIHKLAE